MTSVTNQPTNEHRLREQVSALGWLLGNVIEGLNAWKAASSKYSSSDRRCLLCLVVPGQFYVQASIES